VLASTFFAGINVGADTAAKQALDQNLSNILVDVVVSPYYGYMGGSVSSENVTKAMEAILNVDGVIGAEVVSDARASAKVPGKNLSNPYVRIIGISEHSRVNDGWMDGRCASNQAK